MLSKTLKYNLKYKLFSSTIWSFFRLSKKEDEIIDNSTTITATTVINPIVPPAGTIINTVSKPMEKDKKGMHPDKMCNCGLSKKKPYCDGSHKVVGFRSISKGTIPKFSDTD